MTPKTEKPREFWINPEINENDHYGDWHEAYTQSVTNCTHVIEYSAVAELEQRVAEYKRFHNEDVERNLELTSKLAAAESEVRALESSLDKWISTAEESDRQRAIAEAKVKELERDNQALKEDRGEEYKKAVEWELTANDRYDKIQELESKIAAQEQALSIENVKEACEYIGITHPKSISDMLRALRWPIVEHLTKKGAE